LDALVMAGGKGSRLRMGEKPLVKLFGRPLIDYVVSALLDSSADRIFVAVTGERAHDRGVGKGKGVGSC